MITGEVVDSSLIVDHGAISKKPKKTRNMSTKYTLDLKDAPQDLGGS